MLNLEIIRKKMQKKLTLHCRQCPSEDDCLATCGLLTISIFWEAVKNNCSNSLRAWENSCWLRHGNQFRQKENPRQQHQVKAIHQNTDEWKSVLEEMDQLKTLGIQFTQTIDGTSLKEEKIQQAQAHSAVTRLAIGLLWKSNAISFPTKIKLCNTALHGCDSWTPTADLDRQIQAF